MLVPVPDLQIAIDVDSGVPPYEQVRVQIMDLVSAEQLRVGERLPPIRVLAADLGLAAGTVAHAYRDLETSGVVTTRRGAGTVVSHSAVANDVLLQQAARAFVDQVRAAGLPEQVVLDAVQAALRSED
ncbi:GntR family transcriptional regulator [Sanguibacter antarcticus]|uniref:GntR family transcriptional regulator n=1 Tax=Sanguibacter antarcticus TaxID=372484 RepID=A0A2A9E773_9MICO|nr:GntR family transcriptional regulator [Sanguibacter antarcticus]PFG34082.1 GntR family transcriptional regulator [Sanguibacter antarcticus]